MGAAAIGAGIVGTAGLASAAISSSAAKNAANTQATAEQNAANTQLQMFNQTQANLSPYNTTGQAAAAKLAGTAPFSFNPTEAQLEATPGYQFNLSQGLKATQNGAAAQGLGSSGAALKGAATFASGLADTTYQNQFTNALNSYNTNVGVQQNLANLGENAAAQTGQFGTSTAQAVGQTQVGAANASAAGTVGAATAASQGVGSVANAYIYNNFLKNQGAQSIYTSPSASYNDPTTAQNVATEAGL